MKGSLRGRVRVCERYRRRVECGSQYEGESEEYTALGAKEECM